MKRVFQQFSFGLALALSITATAQTYDTNNVVVATFAGSGFAGLYDGNGTQTMFNLPSSVVADSDGNLFVLDSSNAVVRKITPDATVSTFVGGGTGALPGFGTNVSLSSYFSASSFNTMTIDHSNVLWIAEHNSPDLRDGVLIRIGPDGFASELTLNVLGVVDNSAFNSSFCTLDGICVDSSNNLYIAVNGYSSPFNVVNSSQVLRYRTDGSLEVFAGYGVGAADGNGLFASFSSFSMYTGSGIGCMATDAADNVYVWDSGNRLVRRIDQGRNVSTLAGIINVGVDGDGFGPSATFNKVGSMCVDDFANVFMACGNSIRKLTADTNVVTMAGSFTESAYTNGVGDLARFSGASGICLVSNCLYVADSKNQRIRKLNFTLAPPPTPLTLDLKMLSGVQITGYVGRQYQIESSADGTSWKTETTLTLASSPFLWIDTNSGGISKSYRAWLLP